MRDFFLHSTSSNCTTENTEVLNVYVNYAYYYYHCYYIFFSLVSLQPLCIYTMVTSFLVLCESKVCEWEDHCFLCLYMFPSVCLFCLTLMRQFGLHCIISHHIIYHIILNYITSYHITSHHIISYYITSYHITSNHIISYISLQTWFFF